MRARDRHRHELRELIESAIGSASSATFKDQLVDQILRINDRFNSNPGLDEALNSGDGSYKP